LQGRQPQSFRVASLHDFTLSACDRRFDICCGDGELASLVTTGFGAMLDPRQAPLPVSYRVDRLADRAGFSVACAGDTALVADPADLLFYLDKEWTIALQRQRPDLFFLHGAAVVLDGRVAVVSAPSGTGKSTFAWALLEEGFGYLSDELAPIDLQRKTVHAYPHALCLKAPPPAPYRLPPETLNTGPRLHVPASALSVTVHRDPLPLAALIFIRRGGAPVPVRRIGAAAAAAHLMSNALNSLAHAGAGLDAAIGLGAAVPAFELDSTDLPAACRQVRALLRRL
jgi:hypothetical protein